MTDRKTIHVIVDGATPLRTEGVPRLAIESSGHPPDFDYDALQSGKVREHYQEQAARIVQAMLQTLPGGLVDQVMVALMQNRASMFRVPFVATVTDDQPRTSES